jgi:hypothetical protein
MMRTIRRFRALSALLRRTAVRDNRLPANAPAHLGRHAGHLFLSEFLCN